MPTVDDVCRYLNEFAPTKFAESWDNVGLLVGRGDRHISRLMTCLTLTADTAAEAVREKAELIVTHHPLPFRPLKNITSDTTSGSLLLELIEARVAVYSPHTAFDSAENGINGWLCEIIGIANPRPLVPHEAGPLGAGRWGDLFAPMALGELALRLKLALGQQQAMLVGSVDKKISRAAVGCGSAGELLEPAMRSGCELFVTGEARFHTCLEAEANQVAMIMIGHYASERFALDRLADVIAGEFPDVHVWASRDEHDPISWY